MHDGAAYGLYQDEDQYGDPDTMVRVCECPSGPYSDRTKDEDDDGQDDGKDLKTDMKPEREARVTIVKCCNKNGSGYNSQKCKSSDNSVSDDKVFIERVPSEAIAHAVISHRGIVQALDVWE